MCRFNSNFWPSFLNQTVELIGCVGFSFVYSIVVTQYSVVFIYSLRKYCGLKNFWTGPLNRPIHSTTCIKFNMSKFDFVSLYSQHFSRVWLPHYVCPLLLNLPIESPTCATSNQLCSQILSYTPSLPTFTRTFKGETPDIPLLKRPVRLISHYQPLLGNFHEKCTAYFGRDGLTYYFQVLLTLLTFATVTVCKANAIALSHCWERKTCFDQTSLFLSWPQIFWEAADKIEFCVISSQKYDTRRLM